MKSLKRLLPVALVLVMLLSLVSLAACQNTNANTYNKAVQVARTEIWKDINAGQACSATVAVMDGGDLVYAEGFGVADRASNTPVDTSTLFNMGSVSKTFDAAALMMLVDDGKVKLEAPVTQYLPEFKMADPRYKDITVRMLLNHVSGVPGTAYANNMGYAFNKDIYEETLANLAHSNLKAAPGAGAPYCNDGFTLAEMLIAKVSGKKYIDFLTDRVLTPLSLSRTGLSVGERPSAGISRYYQADTGKIVPPEVLSVLGAGGLSSNATDLVEFLDSFSPDGNHILSKQSLAEMMKAQPSTLAKTSVQETGINPELAYGLGLDLVDVSSYKAQGIKVIGKGGDSDDYHAMMLSAPDKRVSVAVIEAGHGSSAPSIAFDMLKSVLVAKGLYKDAQPTVGAPPAPQPLPPEYAALAGYYAGSNSLYRLSFDYTNNVANIATFEGGQEAASKPLTYRDGSLYSASGSQTKLISVGGRNYLLVAVFGGTAYMTMAENVPSAGAPQALGTDINGSPWLRRNVKPFEALSLVGTHMQLSSTVPALPGYVDLYGLKRIDSPVFAGMFMDGIRDLTELTLLDKNGQAWAQVSEMLYSPVNVAAPLGAGVQSVTIGKNGYNEWLKTDADVVLNVTKPSGARVIVFSPEAKPIYDSEIDTGKVFVPAGSFVELAGTPGNVLKVETTPATGQ